MKFKQKNLVILLVIGLIFPLMINNNINFSNQHKPNIDNLKTSATYNGIWIDDTSTTNGTSWGNWTWARTQPWCTEGNGTQENPYVIKDSIFLPAGSSDCLAIQHSRQHFVVRNCTFKDIPDASFAGFKLNNVTNGMIMKNRAYNNYFGFLFELVHNLKIINNNVSNNTHIGLDVVGSFSSSYYGQNITIFNNTANHNTNLGITMSSCFNSNLTGNNAHHNGLWGISVWNCKNSFITNNNISHNSEDGIHIDDSQEIIVSDNEIFNNGLSGLALEYQILSPNEYLNITKNRIYNNSEIGIILDSTSNSKIWDNEIYENKMDGIYILGWASFMTSVSNEIYRNLIYENGNCGINATSTCNNNSIYKNFFLENGKHAEDYGTDNKWNSTTIGNYWDNHTSPDDELPYGIVDTQYNISGTGGGIDYLPIAEDGAPRITINSPSEGDAFSSGAPNFSITITEDYLDTIWYTLDGGSNNYTFTENGMINQSAWDGMDDGAITLTFYARDIPGYIGSDSVGIIKDTINPLIVINSPAEGERFGRNAPLFNITVNDDNLDVTWYSFDGGSTTYTITNNTLFDQTAWTALAQGNVTITFYANDLAGNEASESVTVIKSVPSGLDPGVIITIVIVSIVGGVAVISVVYIFMKKRVTSA